MDINCRKLSCKFNQGDCCMAEGVRIQDNCQCKTFSPSNKPAQDYTRDMFETAPDFSNSRHILNVNLKCSAFDCLFNKHGDCNANGIAVIDEGKSIANCSTYIKDSL